MSEYLLAGRYRLTDRIATGGMGEVWRAQDSLLNRTVAVKLLPTGRAGDEAFLARFRAEARYAASLSHPGIARVYDYGESSEFGGAYLVMELVEGDPLSAILGRAGRLTPDATLDIVSQSARALEAAHEAGIVHRDIKPGNLLVTGDGTSKITDFGIATAVAAAQASHLTETGMVMGTAMYVSPEQATGAQVTEASDIYSLGVVAYECLAGRPPFTASEPIAIAYAHKHEPVPALPPDVPEPVADLVYHMLAKTPEERPASVREVADRADMLRDALAGGGPAGAPGVTRVDMPMAATSTLLSQSGRGAAATGAVAGAGLPTGPGGVPGPAHAQGDPHRRRRRRVVAGTCAAAVCVLAAAIGVYLGTNHSSSPPTSELGSNTTQHLSTPPDTPSATPTPDASPSLTPSSSVAVQPIRSVEPSYSPTKVRPTRHPTSPAASPSTSPTPTDTGTGTPTTTPTDTPTDPTSSPTSPN